MPSNAAFHPTIETVGFQTAFSVKVFFRREVQGRHGQNALCMGKYKIASLNFLLFLSFCLVVQ
jgi:hypothetical protein